MITYLKQFLMKLNFFFRLLFVFHVFFSSVVKKGSKGN